MHVLKKNLHVCVFLVLHQFCVSTDVKNIQCWHDGEQYFEKRAGRMSLLCKITKGILHACRQRARASPNLGLNAQKQPSSKRRHATRRHMIVKVLPQSLQRTSAACQQTNVITNLIYQSHQGRDCAAMRISPNYATPRQWHKPSLRVRA